MLKPGVCCINIFRYYTVKKKFLLLVKVKKRYEHRNELCSNTFGATGRKSNRDKIQSEIKLLQNTNLWQNYDSYGESESRTKLNLNARCQTGKLQIVMSVCLCVCKRQRVRVRGVTLSQTSNIHRSIKLKSVSTLLSDSLD